MSSPKSYIVALTPSEKVHLFIAQPTGGLEELTRALRTQVALSRGAVFELSFAEVQQNNVFGGKSLTEVLDLGYRNTFHLHLSELIHEGLRGFDPKQCLLLLEVAKQVLDDEAMKHKVTLQLQQSLGKEDTTHDT